MSRLSGSYWFLPIRILWWAEDKAQWWRTLTALPEGLGLILNTHIVAYNYVYVYIVLCFAIPIISLIFFLLTIIIKYSKCNIV